MEVGSGTTASAFVSSAGLHVGLFVAMSPCPEVTVGVFEPELIVCLPFVRINVAMPLASACRKLVSALL